MEKSIANNLKHLRETYAVIRSDMPLAVGVTAQIAANHPELSPKEIQAILSRHTKSGAYLRHIKFGQIRVNLDGSESGAITEEQREVARLRLNERTMRRAFKEKKATNRDAGDKKRATVEQRHLTKVTKIQGKIAEAVVALQART
jgi:sRNA-binding protein